MWWPWKSPWKRKTLIRRGSEDLYMRNYPCTWIPTQKRSSLPRLEAWQYFDMRERPYQACRLWLVQNGGEWRLPVELFLWHTCLSSPWDCDSTLLRQKRRLVWAGSRSLRVLCRIASLLLRKLRDTIRQHKNRPSPTAGKHDWRAERPPQTSFKQDPDWAPW